MLDWVTREAGRASQHLALRTHWEEEDGGRVSALYCLEPSPGTHLLNWRGAWVRLDRVREQHQVDVIGNCLISVIENLTSNGSSLSIF